MKLMLICRAQNEIVSLYYRVAPDFFETIGRLF